MATPAVPYNIPGLPNGGQLPAYTGDAIEQAVGNLVDTFAPLIPQLLPFIVGYVVLMWGVDYVIDHLPGGGVSASEFADDEYGTIWTNPKTGKMTRMTRT